MCTKGVVKQIALLFIFLSCALQAQFFDQPDPYPEIYTSIQVMPYSAVGWNLYQNFFDAILKERELHTVIEVGVYGK